MQPIAISSIPLSKIDLNDMKFSLSFGRTPVTLFRSIQKVGVLNPPYLQQLPQPEGYRVVTGFRRLYILKNLGVETVTARILPASDTVEQDLEWFHLALWENLGTRPLNPIEKSIALNKLLKEFEIKKDNLVEVYLPLLELGSNPKVLDLYLPLVGLETELKQAVVDEVLSVELAGKLLSYPAQDRWAFFTLVSTLRLGKNRQKEFLSLLADLSQIEQKAFKEIIGEPDIQLILKDNSLTVPVRAERIRQAFMRRRYPRFSQTEEKFRTICRKLKLPPYISLTPPAFFEGEKYEVKFSFKDQKEFSAVIKFLTGISQNKALLELEELV